MMLLLMSTRYRSSHHDLHMFKGPDDFNGNGYVYAVLSARWPALRLPGSCPNVQSAIREIWR